MTEPFMKLRIELNDLLVAQQVQTWLQSKLDEKTKVSGVRGKGNVRLYEQFDLGVTGNPVVSAEIRFESTDLTSRSDVLSQLQSKAQEAGVVSSLVKVDVWKHECSHDVLVPSACVDEVMYSWP